MEELFELRTAIEEHRYSDALRLIDEMEEMSRDEKINKVDSYVIIHRVLFSNWYQEPDALADSP